MMLTFAASKQAKLLRLLKPQACPSRFSNVRRFSNETDRSATPTTAETEPAKTRVDEEAVVSQVLDLLQATDNDWNVTELRRLLFSEPHPSPRCISLVTRRLGSAAKALKFFEWLQTDSQSSPDLPSLSSAFQAIFDLASQESNSQKKLLELLTVAKQHNVPLTINSASLLIEFFGRAGQVDEAHIVYNEIDPSLRNRYIRNVLIRTFLRAGRFEDALHVLDEMLQPNAEFSPDEHTGHIIFGALSKIDKLGSGVGEEEIVGLVSKLGERGVFPDSRRLTQLINNLCRIRKTGCAWDVLHAVMKIGGPVEAHSCNALLVGMRRDADYQRMNSLLAEMKEMDIYPDAVTFGILINHLCKFRRVDEALAVFEKMSGGLEDNGVSVEADAVIYNTLIDGLCKVGRREEGMVLMERMRLQQGCAPNTVTYNCLIDGFCKAGEIERSQELFDQMNEEGVSPNILTLNTLVDGMCRHGRINSAIEFFREMQSQDLKGNAVTYTSLIRAFCNVNNINKAMELFDEMLKAGTRSDAIVYHTLIAGLTRAGRVEDACFIASKMKEAGFCLDTVSYNILISGSCKKNKLDKAYKMLKEMEDAGLRPDSVTYNILISYFSKAGDFTTAHKMMRNMINEGVAPTVVTYGALINAYCLSGKLDEAMKIFREMSSTSRVPPNTVIYNTLINTLCKNNDVETALSLLEDMKVKAVKPNTTTYNAIFKSLHEKNWLEKAFELMDRMNEGACNPDYVTMEILTEWLSAVGETGKLKRFVEGYEVTGLLQ
ncbi:pentatricopeptide repeat-containing protein At3g61520, mitochondrial [Malania oleifera]|uniref:pentatricopeptide repeat-containing protein At3g61520, mitochondrial n=1 Tax=Malania oleifera TaxID=397392 RepID=UPI0025AEA60E|nr:pentatricopeptide repeat-containing protein At3g61520, mitochondrial [Malania oleifera]